MNTIKSAVLAALAALSLLVVAGPGSASASQAGFLAEKYEPTATLIGTADTSSDNILHLMGGTWECVPPPFAATVSGPSPILPTKWDWEVPAPERSGECYNPGEGEWTPLDMNDCTFTFDPATETNGTFTIGPPGCGPIELDILEGFCHVAFEPGKGYEASNTFSNLGAGKEAYVHVSNSLRSLDFTRSGPGCAMPPSTGTAEYFPEWDVTAQAPIGLPISLKTVGKLPAGFYLAGKASEKESEQPRFEGEVYPAAISGSATTGAPKFTIAGTSIPCAETSFSTTLSAVTKQLLLGATWTGCTASGHATTINMNSCKIAPSVSNSGPPYVGTTAVSCSGTDQIEFDVRDAEGSQLCLAKVPAQTMGGSAQFENQNAGPYRQVKTTFANTGVKWTRTGLCNFDGKGKEGTNGEFAGSATLQGYLP